LWSTLCFGKLTLLSVAISKQLILLQGCSGAVERVLNNTPGVTGVVTDLGTQKVTVQTDGSLSADDVKNIVAKTGKATEFWS
jgi:copper chaperone CopZ